MSIEMLRDDIEFEFEEMSIMNIDNSQLLSIHSKINDIINDVIEVQNDCYVSQYSNSQNNINASTHTFGSDYIEKLYSINQTATINGTTLEIFNKKYSQYNYIVKVNHSKNLIIIKARLFLYLKSSLRALSLRNILMGNIFIAFYNHTYLCIFGIYTITSHIVFLFFVPVIIYILTKYFILIY